MSTIVNALSFWKPAIQIQDSDNKTLKIDQTAIIIRAALETGSFFLFFGFNPFIIAVSGLAAKVFYHIEDSRARAAIDNTLLKLFQTTIIVPNKLMTYATEHPSFIQKLVNSASGCLNKLNQQSQTLLKCILNAIYCDYNRTPDEREQLRKTFKAIVDSKIVLNDYLLDILKFQSLGIFSKYELLVYALEKGIINVSSLSTDTQFNCWIRVKDKRVAQLLIKKGLDINVKNTQGKTPLLWAIENSLTSYDTTTGKIKTITTGKIKTIVALLENGASIPKDDEFIKDKEGNDSNELCQSITIQELLNSEPFIQKIFTQAEAFKQKASLSLHHLFTNRLLDIRKPMFSEGFSFMTRSNIEHRTLLVALSILSLASSSLILAPTYWPISLAFTAVPILYYKFEWSRTTQALNTLVIEQLQEMFPPEDAFSYAINQENVIDELIKSDFDFNKMNENGGNLIQIIFEFERNSWSTWSRDFSFTSHFSIFKKMTDHLFKQNQFSSTQKYECFLNSIKSKRTGYIKYLLETGKIKVTDLTSQQQLQYWTSLGNSKTASILKEAGFDPNIKDHLGNTPLLILAKKDISYSFDRIDEYDHVQALLEAGANPSQTIEVEVTGEKRAKSVRDFYQDRKATAIVTLLDSYISKQS